MLYKVVLFGTKDTTYQITEYLHTKIIPIDLIVTIDENLISSGNISGFKSLKGLTTRYGIPLFETDAYNLASNKCQTFFSQNTFELGICMGWQRLIPLYILNQFKYGIFGFHGSCGYLPFGRGRSPLNWSIINGDTRFILNLFRYDELADSPNVFKNTMFEITPFDTIRTLQYKNLICAKMLLSDLITAYSKQHIPLCTDTKDPDFLYSKRTPSDGKINFTSKTREIYNLIRGTTKPFPGAYAYCNTEKVLIWSACPFDQIINFSSYAPGCIIDIYDNHPIIRTIDGSLIITDYESSHQLLVGEILN